jgi:ubiquinone/menaquinone biosynthesis C-methylase UbiE
VADSAFLKQAYEVYAAAENDFQQAMDVSLHPRGPDLLYELIAELGLPAGAVVLDVGCGQGGHAIELARRYRLRARGIDPVPRQIEAAQQRLADASRDQPELSELVSFGPGAAENLPVADASVDLVWCRDVMVHVDQLAKAYREVRRVLRPRGQALVYQMFTTTRLEPAEAEWILRVLGCAAPNMRPEHAEAAITSAGLRIGQCIEVGSEWGEYAEEHSGATGRQLLHAARLLRDPGRYIRRFGQANYDVALADSLWNIYRMIGKLSGRVYMLSAPDA